MKPKATFVVVIVKADGRHMTVGIYDDARRAQLACRQLVRAGRDAQVIEQDNRKRKRPSPSPAMAPIRRA